MSSTATTVKVEHLAPVESNGAMESEGVQHSTAGQPTKSVVSPDPDNAEGALLVMSIVHKHLRNRPVATIPVSRLIEQRNGGMWRFRSRWKRNIIAPCLMARVQTVFEELEIGMVFCNELYDAVTADPEEDPQDPFWFAFEDYPMVPLRGDAMLDTFSQPPTKYINMDVHFQGRAQHILTSALLGDPVPSAATAENPRSDEAPSTSAPTPDDLAQIFSRAIEKALVGAMGTYMKLQGPSLTPATGLDTATPSLAPAFRRSMGLDLDRSPPLVSPAVNASRSGRVMTPSPVTLLRREHMSSRRSSPFAAAPRRVSFGNAFNGAPGGGGAHGGGAPDGGGSPPDGGDGPGDGNPGDDDDGHGRDGGGDPGWDRYARGGFRYPLGRERLLQQRGEPPPLQGTTWIHYHCDPNDFETIVDDRTGTLLPWYAIRPDFGEVLCHPVANNVHFMDRGLFLSGFLRRFDPKNQSRFTSNFPAFDGGGDAITLTDYYGRVVRHAMNYNVYVPPLHTLRDGVPLGVWFEGLPDWVQTEAQNCFSGLLAACLKSKPAGLVNHAVLSTIVRQHENGYAALYDLAIYAGHPLLQAYPKPLVEPVQTTDLSLADHLARWLNYIQLSSLHGIHLSDRYFLQQFVGSLHPLVRRAFGSFLEESAARFYMNDRLPDSFAPDRLLTKILQKATHDSCIKLVHEAPRATLAASQAVRALAHTGLDSVHWGAPTPLEVAALSSASRACFLCGDANHLVTECSRLKTIQSDPFQTRYLQRLLTPAPALKAALKPALKPASQLVRQVDFDAHQVNFDDLLATAPPADSDSPASPDAPDDECAADPQPDFR